MKQVAAFLILVGLFCGGSSYGQIQSFEFGQPLTNELSVPIGKVIRIHSLIGSSSSSYTQATDAWGFIGKTTNGISITLASGRKISISPYSSMIGGASYYLGTATLSSINSVSPNNPLFIPGPLTISSSSESTLLLVYEILDNSTNSSGVQNLSQGNSVVIPTSTAGDVNVKMEQSADNVNWTECLPGTYNSSTVKRFFRLRAVEK